MTTEDRYVEIFRLTKAYPNPYGEELNVVEDFNLIIKKGEVVGVIGHSGCGKSTVLTMVAGLNSISGGGVVVAEIWLAWRMPDTNIHVRCLEECNNAPELRGRSLIDTNVDIPVYVPGDFSQADEVAAEA